MSHRSCKDVYSDSELCTLLIGFFTIVAWIVWEWRFAAHPMVPRELFQGQRVVSLAYCVAFVAGMNFFSLLNFWPLLISSVYPPAPVQVGLQKGIRGVFSWQSPDCAASS